MLKFRWTWIAIALLLLCLLVGLWFFNRYRLAPPLGTSQLSTQARRTEGHLALGNPSNAGVTDPNNYLLTKKQYILSYNNAKRIPNWVSWRLTRADLGEVPRSNEFRMDETLPQGWYRVKASDYSGSGYDRGHMIPAADRSSTVEDNRATFLLSNILPQSPDNNQGPWAKFENDCRELTKQGKELYIISGGYGQKGQLQRGKISIPAHTWKVVAVLDQPGQGAAGLSTRSRVIAIDVPNEQGIKEDSWRKYRTTVDQLEQQTGYDFLSLVPQEIQAAIEARTDNR
ncbi:MAG: DNA/RNA non-specific endonuclease [Synechococcales bacterium]|nr:DNA/RNA non-specific endonuclease [Synechococcales bacterium]